jgi:hypothetical protein
MNKTVLTVLTILVLSVIAFLVTYNLTDWGFKKSLLICGGAGAAMILFDLIIFNAARRR